jgi:5-methyltetrahydropteroyltriglutamate--homocysteine methyltransferase
MVVGSMPRPQFFRDMVDRYLIEGGSEEALQRLMDRAIPYVAALQEAAGVDIISDGEWRRKSYIGVIADMVTGFELEKVHVDSYRHGAYVGYTVTGEVKPVSPGLFAREARFLKAHTDREVRVALPTPYHVGVVHWKAEQSANAYPTMRDFIEALVPIIRQEVIALRDEGVRYIQFDDTTIGCVYDTIRRRFLPNPEEELAYAVDSLNRTVDGVDDVHLSLHLCGKRLLGPPGGEVGYDPLLPGLKALNLDMIMFELSEATDSDMNILRELPERMDIGVGCVASKGMGIDTPEEIVQRVKRVLEVVSPERVALHPDCGFSPGTYWDIPIDEAYQKLHNEVLAAEMLRDEFS